MDACLVSKSVLFAPQQAATAGEVYVFQFMVKVSDPQ